MRDLAPQEHRAHAPAPRIAAVWPRSFYQQRIDAANLVAARLRGHALLERLRYRGYQRRGTLGRVFGTLRHAGFAMFVLGVMIAWYLRLYGFHAW